LQKVNVTYSLLVSHGQSNQKNATILLNNKSILFFFQAILQFKLSNNYA